jgi:drug/metabolite transporter (DMT)-like permease
LPIGAAALPVAVYQVHTFCFFASLERMDAVVAILIVFSYPLMVAVAGALFLHEPLTLVSGALVAVGTVGVYLSVGVTGGASATGVLLAFAAAVLFAWYFMGAKRVLAGGALDGLTFSAFTCCVSAVVFPVVAVAGGASLPDDGVGWSAVLGVAVLGTVAGAALLFTGLGHLDAATAAMLSAAEPPFAVLLAALLLDEPVAAIQISGMAIVAISLTGLSYRATRPP